MPWIAHTHPEMKTPLPPPPKPTVSAKQVEFGKIVSGGGHRICLYGPGGIGKTSLCCSLPGPVAFIDLDESLGKLKPYLTEHALLDGVSIVNGIENWAQLRAALQSDGWGGIQSIVIDTATRAEELAVAHTLATVRTEKGGTAQSVEDYGYGKGYQHVFETFLNLLPDLDRHARQGRNVVLVCHDCTTNVPNPAGDDWLRYEPRLQSPNSGKSSIRLRVREWSDHLLFIGYDIAVDKEGKGKGSGTRTMYTSELPFCMAKSRSTQDPIPVSDSKIWSQIIK